MAVFLVLLGCLALTVSFVHHTINGRHGLEARARLIERTHVLEFEIAGLAAMKAKLERDIALLQPDRPDSDLVEEIARDVLGFVRPGDRVLVLPPQNRPTP